MELRRHPRMTYQGRSTWPPEWRGPYSPDNPLPRGEVGILTRVEATSSLLKNPHCVLVMRWSEQEYVGSLRIDEEKFLHEIIGLLRNHLDRPIAEIGRLEVP